jgi:hypothetical protein
MGRWVLACPMPELGYLDLPLTRPFLACSFFKLQPSPRYVLYIRTGLPDVAQLGRPHHLAQTSQAI